MKNGMPQPGSFETPGELPEDNLLPFDIRSSRILAKGGTSTVRTAMVEDNAKAIALKETRREEFATDDEMALSKEFYEYLKAFGSLGKFIPDTSYFKAQATKNDPARSYMVQAFIPGKLIREIPDEELYADPETVRQLLEFSQQALALLQRTRKEKRPRPDFGRPFDNNWKATLLCNLLLDPRYTDNLLIADEPDASGQKVFFVDAGQNMDERRMKLVERYQRNVTSHLQEFRFKLWIWKLRSLLKEQT